MTTSATDEDRDRMRKLMDQAIEPLRAEFAAVQIYVWTHNNEMLTTGFVSRPRPADPQGRPIAGEVV